MADTNTEQVRIFTVKQIIDFFSPSFDGHSHMQFSSSFFFLVFFQSITWRHEYDCTDFNCVTGYECYGHRDTEETIQQIET